MTLRLDTAVLTTALLVAAACTLATEQSDLDAISGLLSEFEAALTAGDAAAYAALFTPDAVSLSPGKPDETGREAIQAAVQAQTDRASLSISMVSSREMEIANDWAYVWATYTGTTTPRSGDTPSEIISGRIVNILKRQPDGSWKIFIHIRNRSGQPDNAGPLLVHRRND